MGRYTVGHSLGGGVIEFMTICMSPLKEMELTAAFSFGAPGITEDPIPVDRELSFPTYRYWMTDATLTPGGNMDSFDLVPWILEGLHGLGHPKYRSIELEATGNMGFPRMSLHMPQFYADAMGYVYGM